VRASFTFTTYAPPVFLELESSLTSSPGTPATESVATNPQQGTHMRKVIALLTHSVVLDDDVAAPALLEYLGSFGDDIFSDDADDPFQTAIDQRRATTARARLVTERRTLNRSQHRLHLRRLPRQRHT
jgi:hypothetical protein